MTSQQLAILNALVTFAVENIPGGISGDEREVAQIVGRWALKKPAALEAPGLETPGLANQAEIQCGAHSHWGLLKGAEAMAAAITILVHRGQLDARSLPADALLDYMQEVNGDFTADCWSPDEAISRLRKIHR